MRFSSILFFSLLLVFSFSSTVTSQGRIGVVVLHRDSSTTTRCVEHEGTPLSLTGTLTAAGIAYSATQNDNILLEVDGEGYDPSAQPGGSATWFVSVKNASGATTPTADNLAGMAFTDGDLVFLQFALTAQTDPPASFNQVCETLNRAAIIIRHSSGTEVLRCITFRGESISAWDVLISASVEVVYKQYSFGKAICAIDGEGFPSDDCFGDPLGRYWGLFMRGMGGTAISSMTGAEDTRVLPGDVAIFFYGTWDQTPPTKSFAQISTPSDVQLHANLHALDDGRFIVTAMVKSPYTLGDATSPAQFRIILPPGLEVMPGGQGSVVQVIDANSAQATWTITQTAPAAGITHWLRVQASGFAGTAYKELGWRSSSSQEPADYNKDGRVNRYDALYLGNKWSP
jgi:hypothetical protein